MKLSIDNETTTYKKIKIDDSVVGYLYLFDGIWYILLAHKKDSTADDCPFKFMYLSKPQSKGFESEEDAIAFLNQCWNIDSFRNSDFYFFN